MRETGPSDDPLDPLFEAARFVAPVSNVARARSLARARARLAARPSATLPRAAVARPSVRKRTVVIAAGFVLMATGVAAAFFGGALATPRAASNPAAAVSPQPRTAAAPVTPPPAVAPQPSAVVARAPGRVALGKETRPGELAVLRRAQAAYARGDYPAVLDIVGQHARRFSNGRLAEESEALRVRSLARCGRGDDAHRALDAFARRFPHSVLLAALRGSLGGER